MKLRSIAVAVAEAAVLGAPVFPALARRRRVAQL